jgi:hypothetical protein
MIKKKCLRCKRRKSYCRGLCKTDYNIANRLIAKGKTTWEKLESVGKSLPLNKTTDWFLKE